MTRDKGHTSSERRYETNMNISPLVLILLLPLFLVHCSGSDDQREFERQALRAPDGYTETDAHGNLAGDQDPDDWRTAPFYQGLVEIFPAFPNPVLTNEQIEIHVDVRGLESIMGLEAAVLLEDRNRNIQYLDSVDDAPLPPGLSILRFDAIRLGPENVPESARGLHRVIIFDRNDNIISYGDILVK